MNLFQNRYQQAVKFLNSLIPKKSSLQILSAIKICQKKESITYEATDLDSFLRVRLPIWGDIAGDYCVRAQQLSKAPKMVATKITPERIYFGNLSIPVMDIKEFPGLETRFFTKPVWEQPDFSKHDFLDIGKRACNYTSDQDLSRGALEGVCFRDGFFYSTNGHYLLKAKVSLKSKKGTEFVIPRTFFRLLSNDFVLDDHLDFSVYEADKEQEYIVARGMSFELVSKLIQGPYPVVENVLPKERLHSYSVEREALLVVMKKAVLYANQKTYLTELIPDKSGKHLQIKVEDKEGGAQFEEIIEAKKNSKEKWEGIAFNAKSMSMILSDAPGRIVTIKAGENQIAAITIEPEANPDLFFLLMPLRKFGEEEKAEDAKPEDNNGGGNAPAEEAPSGTKPPAEEPSGIAQSKENASKEEPAKEKSTKKVPGKEKPNTDSVKGKSKNPAPAAPSKPAKVKKPKKK